LAGAQVKHLVGLYVPCATRFIINVQRQTARFEQVTAARLSIQSRASIIGVSVSDSVVCGNAVAKQ